MAQTPTDLIHEYREQASIIAGSLTRRHGWFGMAEDVEGYALEGLVVLAGRFDPDRGVTFGAYLQRHLQWLVIDRIRADTGWRRSRGGFRPFAGTLSLDVVTGDDGDDLGTLLADADPEADPERVVLARTRLHTVARKIASLDDRTREILADSTGHVTMAEIADRYDLTPSRISQILGATRRRLKVA